jgi:hypothetical protein
LPAREASTSALEERSSANTLINDVAVHQRSKETAPAQQDQGLKEQAVKVVQEEEGAVVSYTSVIEGIRQTSGGLRGPRTFWRV